MSTPQEKAVAVYCGSTSGNELAFIHAAESLGAAIARSNRHLVYGGGSSGLMGAVSKAALEHGGRVVGVIPIAMVAAGGEGNGTHNIDKGCSTRVENVVVDSMHTRKVEMAKRASAFVGLPGGFGTFEEIMEVTTWTQIGIHRKPVILLNILSYYGPLRMMIQNGLRAGFIGPDSERIVVFVDGPADLEDHATFDWGEAALAAEEGWSYEAENSIYDWSLKQGEEDKLSAT